MVQVKVENEWEKKRGIGPDGDYVVAARPIDLNRVRYKIH